MKIAVWLACLILSGAALLFGYTAYSVARVELVYPPQGDFIDIGGTRLHYVDVGQGMPIVLLHGANATTREFDSSFGPLLSKRYRVVAFDRPGYGYSERGEGHSDPAVQAALIHDAIASLGIDRAVLVGHSLGGAVALAFALRYPDVAAGVVLIGGVAYPWKTGVAWFNHVAQWPVVGPLFAHTLVYPVGRWLLPEAVRAVFTPESPPAEYERRHGTVLALRPKAFRASAQDLLHLSDHMAKQSVRYPELS
ncbi:MAG: alpha/beta hydrolase, partial [Gammaproteobacteria bacterium]|nr:alpha/beta hydrolase [Gammaproteobacteria bacterium]